MSWHVLPAVFAFALNLTLFACLYKTSHPRTFVGLLVIFAVQNLCAIGMHYLSLDQSTMEVWVKAYYVVTVLNVAYLCFYGDYVGAGKTNKVWLHLELALASVLLVLIVATDSIISGATAMTHSFRAEHGSLYWMFQFFVSISALLLCGILAFAYLKSDAQKTKVRCIYVGLALIPLFATGICLLIFDQIGVYVNGNLFLPHSIALFLGILAIGESRHNFTDIRRWLPFSPERKMANQLVKIMSLYSMEEMDYKDLSREFEKIVLSYKYQVADASVSKTGKLMGIHRCTANSMLKRHGIKP